MSYQLEMPEGRGCTRGGITQWLKSEGDPVSKGELVVLVESDTVPWEVPSEVDGTLAVILLPTKLWRRVNTPIGIIATEGEDPVQIRSRYPGRLPCSPQDVQSSANLRITAGERK